MLARRFLYVSLGILALSIAYHLGVASARADWHLAASGSIKGLAAIWAHDDAGQAWELRSSGWLRRPERDLPMPVSDVKFMDGGYSLITVSDEGWVYSDGTGWISCGSFPGSATGVQSPRVEESRWGKLKGSFGR